MVIAFTDANMYATSMAQRNVLKSKGLTPYTSLLCAWARHLKMRTQRDQAIRTYVRPLLKLLLIKKIYHL